MLSVIIPSYNEKENLAILIPRLLALLAPSIDFEIVVVDDHSPDGAAELLREIARKDRRVRVIERRNRRGLASACIEGFLASCGELLAVIDADMQHDENLLLDMYRAIIEEKFDVVIGARAKDGSLIRGLSKTRQQLSNMGIALANYFLPERLSDPMSGFFMIRRRIFDRSAPNLSPMGFKILFDLLASYPDSDLRVKELPFEFRQRHAGESKLDASVLWDFSMYLAEKSTFRKISARFISFSIIGALGLIFHLGLLRFLLSVGPAFFQAHIIATAVTISFNFLLNNFLTYRDRRLRGLGSIGAGLLSFYLVCSLGALANVGVAGYIHSSYTSHWILSALCGIAVGTFWNYGMSKTVTWS